MGILRVVLALVVVLAHAKGGLAPMAGGYAVQAFYIISGFYMAMVLETRYTSLASFYANRALRILPTYYVVLIVSAIAVLAFDIGLFTRREDVVRILGEPTVAIPLILANLSIVGQDLIFWFRISGDVWSLDTTYRVATGPTEMNAWRGLLVPQAWSLSLELMFYALAPWLAKKGTGTLVVILFASAALRWGGDALDVSYHLWPRRLFPAELCLFLLGMLAWRAAGVADCLPRWTGAAAVGLVVALIAGFKHLPFDETGSRTLLYVATAVATPLAFRTFKSSQLDELLGSLSYPIYICHVLAIACVAAVDPNQPIALILGVTLLMSVMLLVLVERPIEAVRRRIASNPTWARQKAAVHGGAPS